MATDFKSLPVIDVGPLLDKCDDPDMAEDGGAAEVVRQLDRACRDVGFFYVVGHGIPVGLLKEIKEISRDFFQLPYEEKLKIKLTPAAGYRGYQKIGENVTKGEPDMHEAIDYYREIEPGAYGELSKVMEGPNQWYVGGSPSSHCYLFDGIILVIDVSLPLATIFLLFAPFPRPANPPKFKALMEDYIRLCIDLSRKILKGIALALGGSPYEFEGKIAGDPFWVMRIIGYPGAPSANGCGNRENDIGCGAHTDYGLLTLVNQDDDKTALQVRSMSGEWISAVPIPGSFVCNIGDMLKILSNGIYESTIHRVINNSPAQRICVAFFYETNFDAVVEPLDICKQKGPGNQVSQRAMYGEHLVAKVKTNFAM